MYERLLAIEEAAYGAHHTEVATTLTNMGNVLERPGTRAGAVALFGRLLAVKDAACGAHHTEVANTLRCMGDVLVHQCKRARARAL